MRKNFFMGCTIFVLFCSNLQAQKAFFESEKGKKENVMSLAYWEFWNDKVQAEIDENIEKHRKTDVTIKLDQISPGTRVEVEQISHSFLFGGNIFLFGDFKTPEQNQKYENTFGSLFNAATVPFYWKTLEPVQGKSRYEAGSSYEYRRPPIDPIVDFCESRGINMNGHAIIYGCGGGVIPNGCLKTERKWKNTLKCI